MNEDNGMSDQMDDGTSDKPSINNTFLIFVEYHHL